MNESRKLAPQLRLALERQVTPGQPPVTLMVSLHRELDEAERQVVRSLGGQLRSGSGTIITLNIPLAAVAEFARLDVVQYVELSSPLFNEDSEV